jgi:hypothetical protein
MGGGPGGGTGNLWGVLTEMAYSTIFITPHLGADNHGEPKGDTRARATLSQEVGRGVSPGGTKSDRRGPGSLLGNETGRALSTDRRIS